MAGRNTLAILLVVCVTILVASGVHAHSDKRDAYPDRRPSTPFLTMQKEIADRLRDEGVEIIDDDGSDYNTTSRRSLYSPPLFSGSIRKIIRASYVLNETISGDLDPNLHPTYYRQFHTQTVAKDWFAKDSVVMGAALATHMDSACHVYQSPCTSITDFNATQYTMLPLVVINVTQQVFGGAGNPDYGLSVADIRNWEITQNQGRPLPRRAFVVMLSGWSNRVYNEVLYFNRDASGQKHFPGFSNEAIDWLLLNRPWIAGIGVDTSSVDIGVNWSFHVHYAINGVTKVSVENLKLSSKEIPLSGAYIDVTPVLYQDAPEATVTATIYV